jgi:hypothetical protein
MAAAAAGALVGTIVEIGPHGALGLGAVAIGVVSACFLFAFEIRHLPPALVVVSLAVLSSTFAFVRIAHRVWREQRLLRRLPAVPLAQSAFQSLAAAQKGVSIDVVPAEAANAFCAGLIRPRVLVTRGLLERLDDEEQRAAVLHELEHAATRGPLKVALARIATRTLFWFPALGDLLDRYILLTELEADRAAVKVTSRSALAGALLEVIESPRLAGAVGLADFAGPRIDECAGRDRSRSGYCIPDCSLAASGDRRDHSAARDVGTAARASARRAGSGPRRDGCCGDCVRRPTTPLRFRAQLTSYCPRQGEPAFCRASREATS